MLYACSDSTINNFVNQRLNKHSWKKKSAFLIQSCVFPFLPTIEIFFPLSCRRETLVPNLLVVGGDHAMSEVIGHLLWK